MNSCHLRESKNITTIVDVKQGKTTVRHDFFSYISAHKSIKVSIQTVRQTFIDLFR